MHNVNSIFEDTLPEAQQPTTVRELISYLQTIPSDLRLEWVDSVGESHHPVFVPHDYEDVETEPKPSSALLIVQGSPIILRVEVEGE